MSDFVESVAREPSGVVMCGIGHFLSFYCSLASYLVGCLVYVLLIRGLLHVWRSCVTLPFLFSFPFVFSLLSLISCNALNRLVSDTNSLVS